MYETCECRLWLKSPQLPCPKILAVLSADILPDPTYNTFSLVPFLPTLVLLTCLSHALHTITSLQLLHLQLPSYPPSLLLSIYLDVLYHRVLLFTPPKCVHLLEAYFQPSDHPVFVLNSVAHNPVYKPTTIKPST